MKIAKPAEGEYKPYAKGYIDLMPDDGRVLHHFKKNFDLYKELLGQLPEEKLLYCYAPGKWTLKELLVHLMDDERIYAYRAMCIARNDQTELPGFEQDDYVPYSNANARSLKNILTEFAVLRKSTLLLFKSFTKDMLLRTGNANGHAMSVRAAIYHVAGHELHHINIIKEKYL